jgi:hypothetical protein
MKFWQMLTCATQGMGRRHGGTSRTAHRLSSAADLASSRSRSADLGGATPIALKHAAYKADGWIGAGNTPDEVPLILAELERLRGEADREHRSFETVIGLSTPPDLATFQRLHEQGMNGGVSYPFAYTVGQRSSLEQKQRAMEDSANRFIRPFH